MTSSRGCIHSILCVKALLSNGAIVDALNDYGATALLIAAEAGRSQIVEVSLQVKTVLKLGA